MINAMLLMTAVTAVSASKVVWGLYKGLIVHGGPWFTVSRLQQIVLGSEEYFSKKYPHQVITIGWKADAMDWVEDNIEEREWDWMPVGQQRYIVGFSKQEDAVYFKTTWH